MTVVKIYQPKTNQELGAAQKVANLLEEIPVINTITPYRRIIDSLAVNNGFIIITGVESSETMGGRQKVEWAFMLKLPDNLSGDAKRAQKTIADLLEEDSETSIIGKLKTTKSKSRSDSDNPNAVGYVARIFRLEVEYGQGTTDKPYAIIHGTIFAEV